MRVVIHTPVCAWCESELAPREVEVRDNSPDMEGVSHGICKSCANRAMMKVGLPRMFSEEEAQSEFKIRKERRSQ